MSERTVLVVDDDANVRETIRDILALGGIRVEAMGPCPRVDELLDSGTVALVVTDLNMPQMDGLQMLAKTKAAAKQVGRDIPVFVVTGAGSEGRAQDILDQGATGFFPKPFDVDVFLDRILAALEEAAG